MVIAVLYLVSAIGEQIGWMGFVFPRLRMLLGTVASATMVGFLWAGVHLVPSCKQAAPGGGLSANACSRWFSLWFWVC